MKKSLLKMASLMGLALSSGLTASEAPKMRELNEGFRKKMRLTKGKFSSGFYDGSEISGLQGKRDKKKRKGVKMYKQRLKKNGRKYRK